jgi:hypothetical protein
MQKSGLASLIWPKHLAHPAAADNSDWRWASVKNTKSKSRARFVFDNNWLWTIGRHTLNMGSELRRAAQDDNECPTCGGSFGFSNRTTADPNNIGTTGNAFASFLLGDADSSYRKLTKENRLRNFYVGSYIQDDIKFTSKLTVNAGLRWDIMVPFHELDNNVVYFDSTASNSAAVAPGGTPLLGAANQLGVSGYDRADRSSRTSIREWGWHTASIARQ